MTSTSVLSSGVGDFGRAVGLPLRRREAKDGARKTVGLEMRDQDGDAAGAGRDSRAGPDPDTWRVRAARSCWATSAPTSSRSSDRTPATTLANGDRPTSRARRVRPRRAPTISAPTATSDRSRSTSPAAKARTWSGACWTIATCWWRISRWATSPATAWATSSFAPSSHGWSIARSPASARPALTPREPATTIWRRAWAGS